MNPLKIPHAIKDPTSTSKTGDLTTKTQHSQINIKKKKTAKEYWIDFQISWSIFISINLH